MTEVGARVETRILIRAALGLWLLSAFAMVWEALALQAPDSPLHFGILSGPAGQLCQQSFGLGIALFVSAWLWPFVHPKRSGRLTLGLLLTGAFISGAALLYAASEGIMGAQFFDPRADARKVLYARSLGLLLLVLAGIELLVRSLRKPE